MADLFLDHSLICNGIKNYLIGLSVGRYTDKHDPIDDLEIAARARGAMAAIRGVRAVNHLAHPPRLQVSVPLKIWIADDDRLVPGPLLREYADTLRNVYGSNVSVLNVAEAGHTFPREHPGFVAAKLLGSEPK